MIQTYGKDIKPGDCFEIFGALHQVKRTHLSPQASNVVVLTFEDGTKYNIRLEQYLMKAELTDYVAPVEGLEHPTVHPDSKDQYESMVSHASYLWDADERNDEYERGQVELIVYSVAWEGDWDSDVLKDFVQAEILAEVVKWNAHRLTQAV